MSKSFTLIELLAVTTIILVFSGLSLAYYNNFNQEENLKKETNKLIDTIELAKKKANSGERYNCTSLCGYQFSVNSSGYLLNICCSCDSNGNCVNPTPIITYYFPPNSNINSLDDFTTIFKPLTPLLTPGYIRLKNNNINKCQNVTITKSGIIEVNSSCLIPTVTPSPTLIPTSTPMPTPTSFYCISPGFPCSPFDICCNGSECFGGICCFMPGFIHDCNTGPCCSVNGIMPACVNDMCCLLPGMSGCNQLPCCNHICQDNICQ